MAGVVSTDVNFYGHLFALYLEINRVLEGKQEKIDVDSGRYVGIVTDVIVFLYNRGIAGDLGSVSDVFLELGKCVAALFKLVDSPDLQCYINLRVKELEMMKLMDESIGGLDDDDPWTEKVLEKAGEKVEGKDEEKCVDDKVSDQVVVDIDEKFERFSLSDEGSYETDGSDYETGDDTEGETEEGDTTVTSDESDHLSSDHHSSANLSSDHHSSANLSSDQSDSKSPSSLPGVPAELEALLQCLNKYIEKEAF